MCNVLNVFDEEAEITAEADAQSWFVMAEAGCSLSEARALMNVTGRVN